MRLALPRWRTSVRTKLLLLFGGGVVAAMAAYLALAVKLIGDDRLAYAFDLNQRVASNLSAQVHASMESITQRLVLFGSLAVREGDEPARLALGRALLDADPDLIRVRLYRRGRDGGLVPSTEVIAWQRLAPLELVPSDLSELDKTTPMPLVAAGREPLVVVNRSLLPSAQLLSLLVAQPVEAGNDPGWAVVADTTGGRLQELFTDSKLYAAYLVDAEGHVLMHPDAKEVIARATFAEVPVVAAALGQQGARSGAMAYNDAEGDALLGAWSHVGIARLSVVAESERAVALAATRRLVRLSALFGIAILLISFLFSLYFARRLTRPIQKLRHATAELAAGNYDVDPGITSLDEIGDLARDFRHMARQIREAQAGLVQSAKMAAFGQLGAGITHEVKNPLGAIRGFAQLGLHYFDDTTQVRESLEMIERESDRCLNILQNFLTFARSDPGSRSPMDLNALAEQTQRLVAHQLGTSRTRLKIELAEGLPKINASGVQLQQVLLNLLLNAQQALGEGGVVELRTARAGNGWVEVAVHDDGPGISPEIQARIFEPFFTTKPSGSGTGLGLSISYGIVREHGGELVVESEPGRGATFRVRLPSA